MDVPLLRKDFIVYRIPAARGGGARRRRGAAHRRRAGAAGELQAARGRGARLRLAALVEVHDRDELQRAVDAGAAIVGVNSRNLRTLAVDPEVLDESRPQICPARVIAVAESGIRTRGRHRDGSRRPATTRSWSASG